MEPRPLEELYDPVTLRAIDRDPESMSLASNERLRGSRRAITGAAMFTATLTGLCEVLEPEVEEVYEEIDNGVGGGPDAPVSLFFVPNNPHATRAIVRPWLFESA